MVFLEFSKAFDVSHHRFLLVILIWLPLLRVQKNGDSFPPRLIASGVGINLWSFAIHHFLKRFPSFILSHCFMFVDDLERICPLKNAIAILEDQNVTYLCILNGIFGSMSLTTIMFSFILV